MLIWIVVWMIFRSTSLAADSFEICVLFLRLIVCSDEAMNMWTEKRQTNINWKLYDLWLSEKWTIFRAYEKVQCTNEYGCNIIEKRHERTMFIDPRAPIEGTLKTTTVLYGPFKYITPTTKWQFVGSTYRKNGGKTIFASFRWFQHNCIAHVQTRTHPGCISVCSSTPAYVFIFHAINSRKRARTHHANKHRGNR